MFTKNTILNMSRIFNEFLFIKNEFEIECNDLREEDDVFDLKECLKYTIDLIVSRIKDDKSVIIELENGLPDKVNGDLLKFK